MDRLKEMSDKIESIEKKLDRVVDAVIGNPMTGDGGLVQRIIKLEQKAEFWDKVRWGSYALLGLIGGVFAWIFSHLPDIFAFFQQR